MSVVVLIGFMGTGKSSVGRRLAYRLGTPFVDTGERIAASTGMSVPTILETRGESFFQQLESRVLVDALRDGAVVATSASAVMNPTNEARMHAAGSVVCLTADVEIILVRTGDAIVRPALDPEMRRARITRLLAERADAYGRADLCIDTSHRSVDAVVDEIVAYLRRHAEDGNAA